MAVREAIALAAERYALSPQLLEAVASMESHYRQDAVSAKGALGVMQLMPKTAERLGADPRDMNANILGGAAYLRQLIDAFDGDIDRALAAYNAGPQAVRRHGAAPPFRETRAYVAAGLEQLAADVAPSAPAPCFSGD
jgi:soluble lytic murein transglycosylase-like protein